MKTWALFVDAYRELNSKKLFWITMLLSGLVVAAFAGVGLNERGVAILWFTLPIEGVTSETVSADFLYKFLFFNLGVKFWLSTIATVLALITTAGMIPDFISGGSIELLLSKPISRTRLFLTKFFCGLLFVTMQVAVFAIASVLVIGFRGGVWEFGILLAVPIVVVFYSYLFCVCMLIGLITRSTLAALLLTGLFWAGLTAVHWTDGIMLLVKNDAQQSAIRLNDRVVTLEQQIEVLGAAQPDSAELPVTPNNSEIGGFLGEIVHEIRHGDQTADMTPEEKRERISDARRELEGVSEQASVAQRRANTLRLWHNGILAIKTLLPKTGDTLDLLNRHLIPEEDIDDLADSQDPNAGTTTAIRQEYNSRSLWWIVGTSLIFEAFVLAIGAWIFRRRDF